MRARSQCAPGLAGETPARVRRRRRPRSLSREPRRSSLHAVTIHDSRSLSRFRARNSRDFTVPSGTSSSALTSLQVVTFNACEHHDQPQFLRQRLDRVPEILRPLSSRDDVPGIDTGRLSISPGQGRPSSPPSVTGISRARRRRLARCRSSAMRQVIRTSHALNRVRSRNSLSSGTPWQTPPARRLQRLPAA